MPRQAHSTILLVDQSNSSGGLVTLERLTPGQSVGQSFTPDMAGIDIFAVQASSHGISTAQILLFSGQTVTGTPIAISQSVTIDYSSMQTTEFQFPETVPLVPGSLYTARLDLVAGSSYLLRFSNLNPYSRGLAFNEYGHPVLTVDLVFSEGLASIPEPTSGMLLLLGAVCLALRNIGAGKSSKPAARSVGIAAVGNRLSMAQGQ